MKIHFSAKTILWCLIYLIFGVVVFLRVGAGAQQSQRKLLAEAFDGNPQVKITGIEVGNNKREFDKEFDELDDWIKRLSLEVNNVAAKPIVFLQVNLKFPDTLSSGSIMVYPIRIGKQPGVMMSPNRQDLNFKPTEKLQISASIEYEEIEKFLRTRHSLADIKKIEIEVGFIIFQDGTAWAAGDFLRPDPNNPRRYINVGRKAPD